MQINKLVLLGTAILMAGITTGWCTDSIETAPGMINQIEKQKRKKMTACYKERTDRLYSQRNNNGKWNWAVSNTSNNHVIDSYATCYTQCYNVWNVLHNPLANIKSIQFLAGKYACNACSNHVANDSSDQTDVPSYSTCKDVP